MNNEYASVPGSKIDYLIRNSDQCLSESAKQLRQCGLNTDVINKTIASAQKQIEESKEFLRQKEDSRRKN